MQIEVMPTLIDLFRETFEGAFEAHRPWITDGQSDAGVFGVVAPIPADRAFKPPTPGGRSIAAHAEHLRFSLDLMYERMQGKNPPADWANSFNLPPASVEAWAKVQSELRRAYTSVLGVLQQQRGTPVDTMPPEHIAGLSAVTAHNAYHLGALRQLTRVV